MINFEFSLNTQIFFGRGTQLKTGELTAQYGKKVLIHYGSDRIKRNGILDEIVALLKKQNIEYIEFGGVNSNPDVELAQKGAELCKNKNIDMILAIGGGSVIDSAKAIAIGACSKKPIWEIYKNSLEVKEALPIGVVVTMPATASESNAMSVLSNYCVHEKRAFYCKNTLPKFAILNPEYTLSISTYNTAIAAIDIFSHAFERYFDLRRKSLLWDSMCEAVMKVIIEIAPKLMDNPEDYQMRSELMWAASVAHNNMLGPGGDFTSHELSHILTAEYGLPHGAALAIIMPAWCNYVLERHENKFTEFAKNVWNVNDGEKAIEQFVQFIQQLALPTNLKMAGIKDVDIDKLTSLAFKEENTVIGGGTEQINEEAAKMIFKIASGQNADMLQNCNK